MIQMAGQLFWEIGPDGSVRTDGLHLEGFARILWDALRTSGYVTPPTYEVTESLQLGIPSCCVRVTVPLHPDHPEWQDLGMEVVSVRMFETLEVAALRVLNAFGDQHPLEVFLTPLGLLPTEDPEDPAWLERMGNMAAIIDETTPLETVQELVRCVKALYHLQALRSVATTDMTVTAHNVSGELSERTAHLHAISVGYMDMERDLVRSQQRVVELENHEAQWRAHDTQWVNELANCLQTIVVLQEQRVEMQVELQQLRDERMQHIHALAQRDEQLEQFDIDLQVANDTIIALQQPVPPPPPGAMEGGQEDAQSGMDSEDDAQHSATGAPGAPESSMDSASSAGNLDDF